MANKSISLDVKVKRQQKIDAAAPYVFMVPFLVAFVVFFLFPLVYSLVLSFYSYRGYGAAQFVGFENYIKVFDYAMFWQAMKNTMLYYVAYVVPLIVVSFLLALILNEKCMKKMSKIYKPLIFLPQIIPVVAAALIFRILLDTRAGAINTVFGTSIPFIEKAPYMWWSALALMLWRGIGWYMIIFSAGLTSVSTDYLEASEIDGAGFWQKVFYIIIPVMKPIFLFALIINSINTFKLYTEPTVLLQLQANLDLNSSTVMNILIQNINSGNFGMASAIGWVLFVVIVIVSVIYFKVLGTEDES